MKALVLAAGEGNRFGELTKQKPKALLQIAGMPLYSLIGILFHSALTATVYAYRAAIHMHAIDKKRAAQFV